MYLLFLALIISTLTVFTLVVLFDDISIVTLWQEHKSGIILYLLLVIPSLFLILQIMKRKWNMPLKNIVRVIEINETIIKIIMKQLYQTSRKVLHHSKLKSF